MRVSEAVEKLTAMEQDAILMICAHGFEGKEGCAWPVTHFDQGEVQGGGKVVLVEGAGDTDGETRSDT